MARGVNKVILIGNLGKDPEIQSFDKGVKKASFSLATSETYRNRDGQDVEQTEWHNIILWRGLAEVAEKYLKKGAQVYIEGRIRSRSYEKDGQKRYITEIEGDTLNMLGGRASSDSPGQSQTTPGPVQEHTHQAPPVIPTETDDLPF